MYYEETEFFKKLEQILPPVFSRQEAVKFTGSIFSSGTLRNLDSLGKGPKNKVKFGKKVGYEQG
jgi:hypothetical protein